MPWFGVVRMGYEPLDVPKLVAPGVWIVDGPHIRFYGMPFPTRMTIIRLAAGGLWVHSPTELSAPLLEQVLALGPVKHLIAPNWIHYVSLGDWSSACPGAVTWAAPGVTERAASRKVSLRIDHEFEPHIEVPWASEVAWLHVEGSSTHQEVVFFHPEIKTLVLTDLIENFERKNVPFWMWPILRMAGIADPDGKMPRDMALTFRNGRDELRGAVERMIEWAPDRVILAHGRWYERDGVAELKRAFRSVL